MKERRRLDPTAAALHVLAMACMLCDHLWASVVPGNDWLTCVGRIAFPIFAFLLVEGYFHTKNLKAYVRRLLIVALLSEIPFNLVAGSRLFYPIHQNVLWTFLIAIGLMHWNGKVREKHLWVRLGVGFASVVVGYLAGLLAMVDYYHAGVLTVLTFFFFRERTWWSRLGQLVCLWYINVEMLSGFAYEVAFGGGSLFLVRQGFALLALLPIWLYRGEQGNSSKAFRRFCYEFYPAHLLVLGLLKFIL